MDTKRLFVALWPSPAVQRELAALPEDASRGVAVNAGNLHLTLAFLGNSSAAQEACYRRALAALKFAPVALEMDRMGWWRQPRILWAGPQETPAALLALAENVGALLQSCGFVPQARPFRAHITLRRKHPGPAPGWGARPPVRWLADTVALVWSRGTPQGVCYRPVLRVLAR